MRAEEQSWKGTPENIERFPPVFTIPQGVPREQASQTQQEWRHRRHQGGLTPFFTAFVRNPSSAFSG